MAGYPEIDSHLAELFIPTPTALICETFTHAINTAPRLFVYAYSPILISPVNELKQCGADEIAQASKQQKDDLNPSLLEPGNCHYLMFNRCVCVRARVRACARACL